MAINQDDLLKELLEDFRQEADEHISSIDEGLIELEKSIHAPDYSVLERVYRDTHSLKGAARAVNLSETEKVCMAMEGVMSIIKNGDGVLYDSLFDVMHKSVDALRFMLSNLKSTGNERKLPNLVQIIKNLEFVQKDSISRKSNDSLNKKEEKHPVIPEPALDREIVKVSENETETIRVSLNKLNRILSQSEDLIAIKTTLAFYKNELEEAKTVHFNERLEVLYGDLTRFIKVANRMIDDLIIDVRSTLLMPFSTILNIVPRIVRDLSREKGKEITVEISGDHFEIDKRILEELKDPLVHLIRNCADHGIESTNERISAGKSSSGKIRIIVSKGADAKLNIVISDDGGGIKLDKVVKSAIKNGIIDSDRVKLMSDEEKMNLIFASGVSSSEMITEISGRGLGMAIVAEKICNLGGSVTISSQERVGTSFNIKIPQTIATFRGLLIRCGSGKFLIPSIFIDKVIGVLDSDVITSGGRSTIIINREHIGLMDLGRSLGLNNESIVESSMKPSLILNSNNKKMAFVVDEILEEVEGIVKPLGKQLINIHKITGVTMVGNGILIPVVNVSELIESTLGGESGRIREASSVVGPVNKIQKILIVEDSITVRSMLKSIVENSGYETDVAIDGADAFEKLQRDTFDAVVTDIEMPNMNGFELTRKIRDDENLADLPVILVTTLESPKDMQKGLEAGANAYIVKGSFEKSNLTDTIRRLI